MALAVLAVTVAACSDDDASVPTTLPSPAPTTTVSTRPDDGILRIGLLLPASGEGVTIGQSMGDAARRAILEINDAGGVRGTPVQVVDEDEGETPGETTRAIENLLEQDVDAVVGPASSPNALATLDLLVAANVLTCSPSATALALDEFPDDGLFVRTAPSDSLQAVGITTLAEDTGGTSVAITWVDDMYGRPFADAVTDNLLRTAPSLEVVAEEPFPASMPDLTAVAQRIGEQAPGVVIVIADAEQGTRMLSALRDVLETAAQWDNPDIIVNDALRRPPSPQAIAELPTSMRTAITGLSPAAGGSTLTGPFAANAYDCVNLIALAAQQDPGQDPRAMAAALPELSSGGGACKTFDQCADALAEGLNVDYEGPEGDVEIGLDGNRARANYSMFRFDDQGIDEGIGEVVIPP